MMVITDKIFLDRLSRPQNFDEHWMRLAILEAYKAHGLTQSNPLVGALIVSSEGEILAHAHHPYFGAAHAEVLAIEAALAQGYSLEGATLYCTLEPCCHTEKNIS